MYDPKTDKAYRGPGGLSASGHLQRFRRQGHTTGEAHGLTRGARLSIDA